MRELLEGSQTQEEEVGQAEDRCRARTAVEAIGERQEGP